MGEGVAVQLRNQTQLGEIRRAHARAVGQVSQGKAHRSHEDQRAAQRATLQAKRERANDCRR